MKWLANSTPYLPVEVIEKILILLPAKSIGQWRSVSKEWRRLLSSPQFIKGHASIIRTRAVLTQSVSIFSGSSWMVFTLTNNNQVAASGAHCNLLPKWTYLMGSCDSLVLVLDDASQTFLINPTTRHTREIPTVIKQHAVESLTPRKKINLDGIGFDSVSHDYKVVSVTQIYNHKVDDSSHEVFVHIYSVNDGTWKTCISLTNFFGYKFRALWKKGVFVGRCIHWIIERDTDGIPVIIAFDVVEEKLCQVPNPTHPSFEYMPRKYKYYLGVLSGCLCVSSRVGGYINIWVMNKYGIQESWTKIARIGGIKKTWFLPLCLVGQQNLVLQEYHKGILKKLVTYNLAEKTFKDVDIPDDMRHLGLYTVPFAETMVSPYGMRGEC